METSRATPDLAATYNVMIVDDHPLMRRGLRQLLELEPMFNIVAEASSGNEAIALVGRTQPDIILLDLNMKGLSGLDTLRALRNEGIDTRIIILTVSDTRSDVYALIDAGADGYLLKDSEPELLLHLICDAAQGQQVFSESISEYLSSRIPLIDPLEKLTQREMDILQDVARGLSNKQIATEQFIAEETVKVHVRNLLRKLNVRSRVAATVLYLEYKNQWSSS